MRTLLSISLAAALAVPASSALAQSWQGGYVGVYAGTQTDPDDDNDRILFDTNLDGGFGDTVNTSTGANAFSPGFCDGVAQGATPAAGCADNTGGADFGVRAGYDWDADGFVYGIVLDYGLNDARDGVAAFSTTPARYTMLRKVDDVLALRGRAGWTFGGGDTLFYGTAGYARAGIDNFFATSNGVNTFVQSGGSDADGYQYGLGIEHRFWDNLSLGIEYMHTALDHDDTRVRSQGPAPATNPFILVNAAGTDFRRSDDDFDLDSFRLTANFRF
jgi:outer membrane immunogenic protein